MNLSFETVLNIVDGTYINPVETPDWHRIEIDSRRVDGQSYFLPLLGEVHDGHKFIISAFEKGATVSFCEKAYFYSHYEALKDYALILVDNTTKALHRMTKYILETSGVKVIGITGSVGKTSTKELIYHVLKNRFKVHKNKGNFNNHIGLPLTVMEMEDAEIAILEMGMNHFKEIETLAEMARPDIGVITNIGTSHIGILGSRENIFQAKMEMITYFDEDNTLIVNGNDDFLPGVDSEIFKVVQTGMTYLKPENIRLQENGCYAFDVILDQVYRFKLNVLGKHNIYNALLAIAVGLELSLPMNEIITGVESFVENSRRLERIKGFKGQIISDCYNASQESMISALEVLNSHTGKKIAVLGDVLELGKYAKSSHEAVGQYIGEHPVDYLYTYGKDSQHIIHQAVSLMMPKAACHHFTDQDQLIQHLKSIMDHDSTVLVKGSLGMGMQTIVKAISEES